MSSLAQLERGGDYYLATNGRRRIYFLLPGARDEDAVGARRAVYSVEDPPHRFRECGDGSVEVRQSIAAPDPNGAGFMWHGYLDEGHVWREVD